MVILISEQIVEVQIKKLCGGGCVVGMGVCWIKITAGNNTHENKQVKRKSKLHLTLTPYEAKAHRDTEVSFKIYSAHACQPIQFTYIK